MSEQEKVVVTTRPTRRQRWIELLKDLLILLLSVSAILLAGRTSMLSQLRGLMTEPAETVEPQLRHSSEAAIPYMLAVRNERGLYAVGYDSLGLTEGWRQLTGLLGRAISEADPAISISEGHWRELLENPGFYCAFQGRVPLEGLGAWLGDRSDLVGDVRSLILAWDDGSAWLAWWDGSRYHAARTEISWNRELSPVLRDFTPNGAAYAYALADSDPLYAGLDPYVLVQLDPPRPMVYTGYSPDLVGDGDLLRQFLNIMDFESGGGSAYETPEGLAISEGGDRLRVNREGHILYHGGEDSRYTIPSAGEEPTRQEAALAAWELANRAVSGWKGEGSFVVTGAEPADEGWLITLHFRLGGAPVMMSDTGWAAQFRTEGRQIADFTIHLRTYTARDTATVVPRERLAAAALPSLEGEGSRLLLCYVDSHSDTVKAGWVAELP